MSTFDERERAFENMFAHDEELRFKAEAHKVKAMAQWAAAQMRKSDTDTQAYVDTLLQAFVQGEGSDALMARLRHDFAADGQLATDAEITDAMDRCQAEAIIYTREH